jgi:hypothetical protein
MADDQAPEATEALDRNVTGDGDNVSGNVTAAEPINKRPTRATPSNPTPWRDPKCDRLPGESRRQMQKRLGRKGGRPRNEALERRFVPTQEQREIVRMLAGCSLPHDRIVRAIRNPLTRRPISVSTLARAFEHELDEGRAVVDQMLAATLLRKLKEGNVIAIPDSSSQRIEI